MALFFQTIMAKQVYADASEAVERLHRRFAQELGAESSP